MFTQSTPHKRPARGFTLIELMLVVAILGVLGLVVAQNIIPYFAQSQQTVARANIETLSNAVKMYKMQNKLKLPGSLQELLQPNEFNMGEPYIEKEESLYDPWGNEYVFNLIGRSKFEIISLGADGMEGGEGEDADISSKGEMQQQY